MVIRWVVGFKAKIQDSNGIDAFQTVIPLATRGLLANGKGRVIDAAVFEELLLAFLHLHQKVFTFLVLAIYIKHGTPVVFLCAQMLGIEIGYLTDFFTTMQQCVQETDEQIFIDFCSKQLLKCKVRIEIDVSFVNAF